MKVMIWLLLFISLDSFNMNRQQKSPSRLPTKIKQSAYVQIATTKLQNYINDPLYSPLWKEYGYSQTARDININSIQIIKNLINQGADPNIKVNNPNHKNTHGQPLLFVIIGDLHYTDLFTKREILRELLIKGIDLHALDANGNTVIMKAIDYNDPELVSLLLENGANLFTANNDGKTALQIVEESSSNVHKQKLIEIIKEHLRTHKIP